MNPKVDWFFDKVSQWKDEFRKLREIVLECHLVEELKWGPAVLHIREEECRPDPRIQGILCASVLQGCSDKG
jgi:hypothetical protein